MKLIYTKYFLFATLLFFSSASFSQILLSEGFENGFPPTGWAITNEGQGNGWTLNSDTPYIYAGSHSMVCKGTPNQSVNAWAITSGISLKAGVLYKISYQFRTQKGESQWMVISIGNSNLSRGQTKHLDSFDHYKTTVFTEERTYFRTDTAGIYYVGFNCKAYNNSGLLCLDNIQVEVAQPAVRYVNASATGLNNGTSWQNAFTSLQTAMLTADKGDTIKVARGTYKPAIKSIDSSFGIKEYAVLLGGYPAVGNPSNADRSWQKNETILSGYYENYSHAKNILSSNNNSKYSVLDGFIIQQGVAQSDYNWSGNKTYARYGGGIYLYRSSTTIRNCIFKLNDADDNGASIGVDTASYPVISNCLFTQNGSSDVFVRSTGHAMFYNCVFAKDTSDHIIYCNAGKITFTNCTFFANHFYSYPYNTNALLWADNGALVTINNSIFYKNKFDNSLDSVEILTTGAQVVVSNTITQNYNYGNKTLTGAEPKFRDTANIFGADGIMFTDDDGLQLVNPCSPGINAGNNSFLAGITTDILGNSRIADGTADLGAYEVQSPLAAVPHVLYVNKNAAGKNDGSSWANAFTDLQKAFAYCSDTIKVAAGTYYPSDRDVDAFFKMQNHRVILGGYPATGSPFDTQRNPSVNNTVISGKLPQGTVLPATLIKSSWNDTTAVLDGFTVTDANGYLTYNGGYLASAGAINIRYTSSPVFRNLVFFNNMGTANGSAVLAQRGSSPRFLNCTFLSDSSYSNSSVSIETQSAPVFTKCVFADNNEYVYTKYGANSKAAYIDASNPVFDSCTFRKNLCTTGVIYNGNGSAPVIKNCTFIDEIINGLSAGIYSDKSSPQVSNCLFIDTAAKYPASFTQYQYDKALIENHNGSQGTFTNCRFFGGGGGNNTNLVYNAYSTAVFTGCLLRQKPKTFPNLAVDNYYAAAIFYNCVATGNGNIINNTGGSLQVTNCTFVNNTGTVLTSGYGTPPVVSVTNSVFWKNVKLGEKEAEGTVQVSHSFTQSSGTDGVDGNHVGKDPRFVNVSLPAGPDSVYFTADDGLALCSCSPAINTGLNSAVSTVSNDVLNQTRLYDNNVDIGAYEYQQPITSVPKTYYVNAKATGAQTGASWNTAYSHLQSAFLNPCADTIKIAAGVYKPAVTDRDTSFEINHGLMVLGGYPNAGNPADALRNAGVYKTVLDGDIGAANDTSDNTYTLINTVAGEEKVTVDGLTLRNANNSFVYTGDHSINTVLKNGGGLRVYNTKSITVYNCAFENNWSRAGGGMDAYLNGTVLIDSCLFLNNGGEEGAGIYSTGNTEAYLKKTVLAGNEAEDQGGALNTTDMKCSNIVFYHNKAAYGAGAYVQQAPSFINCSFVSNHSPYQAQGVGIYNYDGTGKVYNCIFSNNYSLYGLNSGVHNLDFYTNEIYNSRHDLDIQHSIIQSYVYDYDPYNSGKNIEGDPVFLDSANGAGPDGKWMTEDDGLKLVPCSPCINLGSNTLTNGLTTDLLNHTRYYNITTDMGAYEYQGKQGPAVAITASADSSCAGELLTFIATSGFGGSYNWYVNGIKTGDTTNTYTSASLHDKDLVNVLLKTDSATCLTTDTASSNAVAVIVHTSVIPSVAITSSANTVCQGTQVVFTPTPVNGGSAPSYQWFVNDSYQSVSNTFISNKLNNGDKVKAKLTSSVSCAVPDTVFSNVIAMLVNPVLKPTGTITAASKICLNDTLTVHFAAGNSVLPGTNIQLWESQNGNPFDSVGAQLYNSSPLQFILQNNGETATKQYFINLLLPTSTACAVTNHTDTVKTMIEALEIPVLAVNTPVITISNPDAAASYAWQKQDTARDSWTNVLPASTGISYTAAASGVYRVTVAKGACNEVSEQQAIIIVPVVPPSQQSDSLVVHAYPNPASSYLVIDSLKEIDAWETIEVLNTSGHLVLPVINSRNQTMVRINVAGLSHGLYIAVLKRSIGAPARVKFLKQ